MAATVCELKWLSYILSDFGISVSLPIQLYCDNQAAMHIMANPVFHERTKHIELDCHVFQTISVFVGQVGSGSFATSPTCGGAVKYTSDERGAILSELQHHEDMDAAGDEADIAFLDSG
ncbi:UNVERIFIED_CONTAM: hypothetical protein Sangu_0884700 [Sesamum angustifolium]|uniref:Uncharacterized protein n=1 Tax=Sesamum angustifolium TaxID=2727405 RepID=A0AAW2PE48_9LAMI